MEGIVWAAVASAVALPAGYLIGYLSVKKQSAHFVAEAKAKASAIEQEAALVRKEAELEAQHKREELEERRRALIAEQKALAKEREAFAKRQAGLEAFEERLKRLEEKKNAAIDDALKAVSQAASYTPEEAKRYILQKVVERSRGEIAAIVRKYERLAKEEAKQKANYILAQATTRYAGDFAGERLINVIRLPTDEHKGRIIGKEGRNIKTLETLLGVDIIIDETPETITVSSFNLYRRAVATRVIEILVEDGRIHPARIEEVHEKVLEEFDQKMYEEGEAILLELGILGMHEELVRLLGRMKYRASYGQNALKHTLEVAKLASVIAAELGGDEKLAMRAGLLHDIGKALTQEEGGSHVDIGAALCKKHGEDPVVINAIYAHHGHEEPNSIESAAVCAADALSAARPGARRAVMEEYLKRMKEIESIALQKDEVLQAYALNAGRELRVIVNAKKIGDNETVFLAKQIAEEIEKSVRYPGEIKVNVIRETRATSVAK